MADGINLVFKGLIYILCTLSLMLWPYSLLKVQALFSLKKLQFSQSVTL